MGSSARFPARAAIRLHPSRLLLSGGPFKNYDLQQEIEEQMSAGSDGQAEQSVVKKDQHLDRYINRKGPDE